MCYFCYRFFAIINTEEKEKKLTESVFVQHFGHMLSGAKDWDGHRKKRTTEGRRERE